MDVHERYEKLYTVLTTYDTHFSTVRTTATTFLASIGVLSSLNAFEKGYNLAGLLVALFFLALGFWMNLNFSYFGKLCQALQERVEEELSKDSPSSDFEKFQFRRNLNNKDMFPGKRPEFGKLDRHSILYICGSVLYILAIFGYIFLGFPASSACTS